MVPKQDVYELLSQCDRFLSYNYSHLQTPRQVLTGLAEMADESLIPDRYGEGTVINDFEAEIAELLGKEAALFMPSGTMAQQIALRIWADRSGIPRIAYHPKSHLEVGEHKAYQALHGLHAVLVGSYDALLTRTDLEQIKEPIAALLLELPQRAIGCQLPTWNELTTITSWAKERGVITHLDGARLWESQPFYGRSHAEIAALFDTVYVSFYKGLAGLAGSILAGPADIIDESRIWLRRHGGNLIKLYPYVLSARKGLEEHLERMGSYYSKAIEVATVLDSFPEIEIVPNPPHSIMMHVYIRGERKRLEQAALEIIREQRVYLFSTLETSQIPAYQRFEIAVGDATLDLSSKDIRQLFETLLRKAKSS